MPVRQMLPRTRRPTELPAWELTDDDGKVVGWIESKHLRGASATFYEAIALHPVSGAKISLELSTDFHERAAVIFDFRERPDRYRQHLGFTKPS